MQNISLFNCDCFDLINFIEKDSVDMILIDPPYQITHLKWDIIIPFEPMWQLINKVIKKNCAIAIMGNQPYTSTLIMSNYQNFKYCWTWDKVIPSGMGYARYRPMQQTEDICIFEKNGKKIKYNPQMIKRENAIKSGGNNIKTDVYGGFNDIGKKEYKKTYEYKNPTTLLKFKKVRRGNFHPTQKPIELMEYLIKTYTDEKDVVLDFCMGVGTTGIAAKNLNRKFIGCEKDEKYFNIAKKRIEECS